MASCNQSIDEDRLSIISEASIAVANLEKSSITEVKCYCNPPVGVKDVLMALLILFEYPKSDRTWNNAKRLIADPKFKEKFTPNGLEKIPHETRKEAMGYLSKYTPEEIMNMSKAAGAFYNWAMAVVSD